MSDQHRGLRTDVEGLLATLRAYVAQETIGPLRGLGRYLSFGVASSVCFGAAAIFLTLAAIRSLQELTTIFEGTWSFVPYLAGIATALCFFVLALLAIKRDGRRR
ncbi:MAG: hypothetical protein VX983_00495 [Actinomycetota bacterium]|nr:hypothetical protein [Acidimicrobiaceae bacterium]MBQ28914.1 hypothetical protein [Acidimicrobiaceae bacterium]MCS5674042.1 hypothetical protein [Acidimicrobiales bacterium]MED5540543.1 hypothetical protein [Actinomycetota bacterium]MEE2806976.1 hypothetical protein [Actinomycetota bacterium]